MASSHSIFSGVISPHIQDWAKWDEDDSCAIAVLCQSCELPIHLAVYDLPTVEAILEHLRRLYLPSRVRLRDTLWCNLSLTYQRDRSVQDFYIELSDLWRQLNAMSSSSCSTCESCLAVA